MSSRPAHRAARGRAREGDRRGAALRQPTEAIGGPERFGKAACAAAAATAGTLLAHLAGGGDWPHPAAVLAAMCLSMLLGLPLCGRAVSAARLSLLVLAGQLVFHLLFSLAAPRSTGVLVTVTGHPQDAAVDLHAEHASGSGHAMLALTADGGPLLQHLLHLTPAMLLAHGVAAALTVAVLWRGEQAFARLVLAAGRSLRRLLGLARIRPGEVPDHPTAARVEYTRSTQPQQLLRGWPVSRRGPPAAPAL